MNLSSNQISFSLSRQSRNRPSFLIAAQWHKYGSRLRSRRAAYKDSLPSARSSSATGKFISRPSARTDAQAVICSTSSQNVSTSSAKTTWLASPKDTKVLIYNELLVGSRTTKELTHNVRELESSADWVTIRAYLTKIEKNLVMLEKVWRMGHLWMVSIVAPSSEHRLQK